MKEIRCPNDNTLLVTLEPTKDGQLIHSEGMSFMPRPDPADPTKLQMFAICPKCRHETFAFVSNLPKKH